jgi:formate hydrogenlyase subunit 3/multisubunit Na+/H+ antiporter MnhD subunit
MSYSPQLSQQQQQPPTWALEPATAWIYLVVSIALALTPVFFLGFLLAIVAAVFTHQDRKAHGYPAFWWTVAVVIFGALGYLFFVYKRPRKALVYSPEEALSQQDRLARGLPPLQAAAVVAPSTPADWYPDPTGGARLRYWDGANWTDHTSA